MYIRTLHIIIPVVYIHNVGCTCRNILAKYMYIVFVWEVDRKAHTWKVRNFVMSSSLVVVVMGNSRSVFRLESHC